MKQAIVGVKKLNFELDHVETAVIVGAGRGIGFALVETIVAEYENISVFCSYNNRDRAQQLFELKEKFPDRLNVEKVDATNESDVEKFSQKITSKRSEVQLLMNSVGVLHSENIKPEKSLGDLSTDALMEYFKINSTVTPILAKYFFPLFKHKKPSCFCSISAKVGSISDNRLGGWYGYRASKSALNMFIKNISLEFQRRNCKSLVIALHPGTTVTDLSKPYIGRSKYKLHSPQETARNLLNVIDGKSLDQSGSFLSWDGETIPW